MSAATISPDPSGAVPAGAPSGDTGSGGSPSSQSASGAAPDDTSAAPAPGSSGGANPGDYEAKIRAGGDEAVQEFKNLQGRTTRAEQEWAPVRGYLKEAGIDDPSGTAAKGLLESLDSVLKHPELGKAVADFLRTGEFKADAARETSTQDDPDEWKDPETEALRERVMTLERGTTTSAVKGYIESFMTEEFDEGVTFGEILPNDVKLRIVKGLNDNVKAWGQTEPGLAQLKNLQESNVHAMLMGQLKPKDLKLLTERVNAVLVERRKEAATGDFSSAATTGRDASTYEGTVGDAIAQFCRENGLDPSSI